MSTLAPIDLEAGTKSHTFNLRSFSTCHEQAITVTSDGTYSNLTCYNDIMLYRKMMCSRDEDVERIIISVQLILDRLVLTEVTANVGRLLYHLKYRLGPTRCHLCLYSYIFRTWIIKGSHW
jgi:hypothetical protein